MFEGKGVHVNPVFDPTKVPGPHNDEYSHQEYPKALYKGKETLSVGDPAEHEKAVADGWSETPSV